MRQVVTETDKRAQDMCASIGKVIDEQNDIRKIVEELARRIDAMRDGTHPRDVSSGSNASNEQNLSDVSVAMQLEIENLKTKVARLTEQTTQHTTGLLTPLDGRVDLVEKQIIKWRYRLPELTDDEDTRTTATAVEVQEELNNFRELTRRKIHEIRQETNSLEAKIGVLERARSESWELVSHRLTSMLDRTATTLSDRMTELEQMVQSQGTTPATVWSR